MESPRRPRKQSGWPRPPQPRRPRARTWTLDLQARIERIPQSITEEIDAQNGDENRQPRESREPPGGRDVDAAIGEHSAPRRGGRLDAEPQERERRFDHDHARHVEGGDDEPGREGVRQDVPHEDAAVAATEGVRGLYELAL